MLSPRTPLDRLLRPRSVAIVGASPNPSSFGANVLSNLENAGYAGDIYLVNPNRSEIGGRACVPAVDALPENIDCAVFAIPKAGVLEAAEACGKRGVGALIIFSAGFAESGAAGRVEQEQLADIARQYGMIVEGPNCLGMVNFIDGIPLTFVSTPRGIAAGERCIALASQSGAMAAVVSVDLRARELPLSFSVSTGNEAASNIEDYVDYLIDDPQTAVIAMVVEQFRRPRKMLAAAARAHEARKHIVLLHPGRSSAARTSAETHTGAMAGSYEVMRTKVSHAGIIVVDTLEELIDVAELLARQPARPVGGTAVLTESGAFKALTLDFCDTLDLPLPALSHVTADGLRSVLPAFIPPSNPLDITAQSLVDPDLYRRTLPWILADDRFGSVVLAIILTDGPTSDLKFPPIIAAIKELRPTKPLIFAGLDEGAVFDSRYLGELRALGVTFFPSPERAFRALARITRHQNPAQAGAGLDQPADLSSIKLPSGVLPEYRSKQVLAALGVPVPAGQMAQSVGEAQAIAEELGYPVVLKAQSPLLSHKSDAGGVALNLRSLAEVTAAWERMLRDVEQAQPGLELDGILVERMGARGVELIVGAHNDPEWGPVLMVGFGGVLAEALHDVRLLAPDLSVDAIVDEMNALKSATLLRGFRGSPPLDVRAAATIVQRLGKLMLACPAITEVDINPLVLHEHGTVALDALIVSS